jgi:hypothetical protein
VRIAQFVEIGIDRVTIRVLIARLKMKIQATRSTALIAGAWTSLTFALFGGWTPHGA